MFNPKMVKSKGDGIAIQLAVKEGSDPTILCVHGLTANCRCWDLIVSELPGNYNIISMDLRGRGRSDRPETGYAVKYHIRDIDAMLAHQGVTSVVLLGHSLGAYISLVYAATYPDMVKGLILMDGGGDLVQAQWDRITQAIKPSLDRLGKVFPSFEDYTSIIKLAPFLQPWLPTMDTYFRYEIEQVSDGIRSSVRINHIQEEITNMLKLDVSQYYQRVACPVLILRSTEGILTPDDVVLPADAADRMINNISNARCIDIEGTNHFSILFQPNEKRKQSMDKFLKQL